MPLWTKILEVQRQISPYQKETNKKNNSISSDYIVLLMSINKSHIPERGLHPCILRSASYIHQHYKVGFFPD